MTKILSCFVDMLVTHPKHTSELLDYWMNDIVNAITYISTVVNCKHPGVPANGNVNLTNTTLGCTVTYTCNIPFVLCGDDTRTCLPTGVWSGVAPSCNLISEYSQCVELSLINVVQEVLLQ